MTEWISALEVYGDHATARLSRKKRPQSAPAGIRSDRARQQIEYSHKGAYRTRQMNKHAAEQARRKNIASLRDPMCIPMSVVRGGPGNHSKSSSRRSARMSAGRHPPNPHTLISEKEFLNSYYERRDGSHTVSYSTNPTPGKGERATVMGEHPPVWIDNNTRGSTSHVPLRVSYPIAKPTEKRRGYHQDSLFGMPTVQPGQRDEHFFNGVIY